jgi:hypothetical protein
MDWIESHILQLVYWLDYVSQFLPLILTVALVFTFFLVQSFGRKLTRMAFYLDHIDNHLRDITLLLKEHQAGGSTEDKKSSAEKSDSGRDAGDLQPSEREA